MEQVLAILAVLLIAILVVESKSYYSFFKRSAQIDTVVEQFVKAYGESGFAVNSIGLRLTNLEGRMLDVERGVSLHEAYLSMITFLLGVDKNRLDSLKESFSKEINSDGY